jgi:hypothetical protein
VIRRKSAARDSHNLTLSSTKNSLCEATPLHQCKVKQVFAPAQQ